MTTFGPSDDLRDARFTDADLRGARFTGSDLSGAMLRGVELQRVELDSPWLFEGGNVLLVNGVDVLPFVEAELNRRFPGRAERQAGDPDGLRAAWAAVGSTWAATVERVAAMPDGTVDRPVDGEWSFAQTLRHLVLATDLWLGKAVLDLDEPMHPIGLLYSGAEFSLPPVTPSYAEVLEVRAGRMAMVGEFLATVTPEVLAEPRRNPHAPEREETVLHCLHVILEEEWEHHRYAVRDLDAVTS
ncbi:DinB family protein [Dactylosporangium sp. NPDC005555]|uniref:DinB family protein n=1 Tax=Dactylosporangium sp. NPDC005555 TaxID=3154889 RepID=UPI0033B18232